MIKSAIFSKCRKYRYSLSRIWTKHRPLCLFVCLNPSTANENIDDPTIRRCVNYAKSWLYGGMIMVNLFAYRSTDPKNLLVVDDPIGNENDYYIKNISDKCVITIAAWGSHKLVDNRFEEVLPLLNNLHYLKLTKSNKPHHPLYLKKNLVPIFWKK